MKPITADTAVPLLEACQKLGMSRERVMRRIYSGQLNGRQVFGRWVVDAADLERAVAQRREPVAA